MHSVNALVEFDIPRGVMYVTPTEGPRAGATMIRAKLNPQDVARLKGELAMLDIIAYDSTPNIPARLPHSPIVIVTGTPLPNPDAVPTELPDGPLARAWRDRIEEKDYTPTPSKAVLERIDPDRHNKFMLGVAIGLAVVVVGLFGYITLPLWG